jgi:histidinol dehydrogenase
LLRRIEDVREVKRNAITRAFLRSTERKYVEGIISDVAERGDEALLDYTSRSSPFDNVRLDADELRVPKDELKAALEEIGGEYLGAMKHSIKNLRAVSRAQLKARAVDLQVERGVRYLRVRRPLQRIGITVPAGLAPYPSALLMAAVPALAAGVGEIAICTPPTAGKGVHAAILAAACLLGLDEIYRCNLVAGVGAMAFGTQSIKAVDKIVGAGNRFVQIAKQVASSFGVQIDMPAGPSEIAIIADEAADKALVAWDIIAQAEHSEDSKVFLITTSRKLADEVDGELAAKLGRLKRREIVKRSLEKNGIALIVNDLREATEACDLIAPEHVAIQAKGAMRLWRTIRNCGTILIGDGSGCAISDYATGSSHILPTGGYARMRGGLSADDFVRHISIQKVGKEAVRTRWCARELAELEGLEAHALSIGARK